VARASSWHKLFCVHNYTNDTVLNLNKEPFHRERAGVLLIMWHWKRAKAFAEIKDILLQVEPTKHIYDPNGICSRFPDLSRAYVGFLNNGEPRASAIAIATLLPKSKVLHIEDFALCESARKQGLAHLAWSSWRVFVADEWYDTRACGKSLSIEVYVKNVEAWGKIMGVIKYDVRPMRALPQLMPDPNCVVFMGSHLDSVRFAKSAYAEFQEFQRRWVREMEDEFDAMLGGADTKVVGNGTSAAAGGSGVETKMVAVAHSHLQPLPLPQQHPQQPQSRVVNVNVRGVSVVPHSTSSVLERISSKVLRSRL
jgi:hypothetical protein